MTNSNQIIDTCNQVIDDYHITNSIHVEDLSIFFEDSFRSLVAKKCLNDTVQWHLEDEIRNPNYTERQALTFKRLIDKRNQSRTDYVEQLDQILYNFFLKVKCHENATMNSETPAWIIDRLSILCLKIYHMKEQTERSDVDKKHIKECMLKLNILLEQKKDLSLAFDQLLEDLGSGKKYMKLYLQMKMYNDETLNPALYNKKA